MLQSLPLPADGGDIRIFMVFNAGDTQYFIWTEVLVLLYCRPVTSTGRMWSADGHFAVLILSRGKCCSSHVLISWSRVVIFLTTCSFQYRVCMSMFLFLVDIYRQLCFCATIFTLQYNLQFLLQKSLKSKTQI